MDKRIAPSILSSDFGHLAAQIALVESGGADMIHIDIMDGHFVPNLTIGPIVVQWIRKVTKLPFDVHLMIENADRYIEAFAKKGADLISVHYEASVHLNRTLNLIKSFRCKAGVVLNPATPVSFLYDTLHDVDFVLLMSVNPGFGGQKFLPHVIEKVSQLHRIREEKKLEFAIEIDGGVGSENLPDILAAGADWFVAGSSIFDTQDPAAAVARMKSIVTESLNP